MTQHRCTSPKILGFDRWFQEKFGDLCHAHDVAYLERVWSVKMQSDYDLTAGMIQRGYFWLGVGTFLFVASLGSLYWLWKKYKI